MILGIDEVGRGPWAGPLVIGAVVLGGAAIEGLTDSKKLTKKKRDLLDVEIREKAVGFGLGWVTATEIDDIGLSAALNLATKRAVEQVKAPYHEIIIDGTVNFLKGTSKESYVTTLKKADLLIPSVSAASIIAKVARDNYMIEQDEIYEGYNFKSHVGYGTAAHRAAIDKLGVTPLHRLSFAPLNKYRSLTPLPSSKLLLTKSSRRSLATGPVDKFAPSDSRTSSTRRGSTPFVATRASALTRLLHKSSRSATISSEYLQPETDQTPGLLSVPERSHSEEIGGRKGERETNDKKKTTKQIGDAGETAAANYLVRLGHEIIDRNWRTKYCEIDIISFYRDTLYFTEVKYRKNANQGGGLAAITRKKQNQMAFAAKYYALANNIKDTNLRLAAMDVTGQPPEVQSFLKLG
jgi:ribonuclease HII